MNYPQKVLDSLLNNPLMLAVRKSQTKFSDSWILLTICTVAIQATNVNLGGIKLAEFVAIGALPIMLFVYRAKIGRTSLLLIAIMALIAGYSLITDQNRTFFTPSNTSIIKQPFFITGSRLLSFLLCAVILDCARRGTRKYPDFALRIVRVQAYFAVIFLFIWLLSFVGVNSPFVNSHHRLYGFYNEGGPVGLMFASMFCVSWKIRSPRWIKLSLLLCVFASSSKAGISLLIFAAAIQIFFKAPKLLKPIMLIFTTVVILGSLSLIGNNYIDSITSAETMVADKMEDPSFVMGRIAGSIIAPRMFADNPLLGVGLGNYSLVRNDPSYRGVFPYIDYWDLPGLGGWATTLAECGLVGVLLTASIFLICYRRTTKNDRILVILSTIPFALGVQMYFAYPWIVLGLAHQSRIVNSKT